MRPRRTVRIVGTGCTPLGALGQSASSLMESALHLALSASGLSMKHLDGLIAVPSLSHHRFMHAHALATATGMLPHRGVRMRTIDTGGAGPISALLEAARMVRVERCNAVAVVAGDAVSSMPTADFLRRADAGCADPDGLLPSPVIPHGYDRVARWQMEESDLTREQLAMVPVLASRQAMRHPLSLTKAPLSLDEVLASRPVAPATNLLECARRADGGAAFVVADSNFIDATLGHDALSSPSGVASSQLGPFAARGGVVVLGGGEASGPLYPPPRISDEVFSCEHAAASAYSEAQLLPSDIDWFGLYDCFPICYVRALEAVGLARKGEGGRWVERAHAATQAEGYEPSVLPVNTHGGLLGFGAPWEVPAMYNVIEACDQLLGTAGQRQVGDVRRALVYGNGGIFSHSAVAILAQPVD
mmetsp:Transcript_27982/g.88974  ORF Transcript_27982/g.88974 Transcript_27982/m.88974 type:complete len:417 (+) Transcript_27982:122-1372(+)